jgi:3-methyladenine DNA glycosylase AlkD
MDPRLQPLLDHLKSLANPANTAGMAHYGIKVDTALGIPLPVLRSLAKGVKSHDLALQLWDTGIHEARMLASMVDDYRQVTPDQMESWAADFDSWDICDGVCGNLFAFTPYAREKAIAWCGRDEEYVKRAGFAMIAWMAVHNKKAPDDFFLEFLPLIERGAYDERNFVKKAVNWALRQIGKRNPVLWQHSMDLCLRLEDSPSKSMRWVVKDARKEFELKKEAIFSKKSVAC